MPLSQMSILVEQQDEQITVINDTVKEVEKDVETGLVTSFMLIRNLG